MPAVTLSPIGNGFQFFTASGLPLSGGLLNTYIAGTSTPLATYTDSAGSITNANPIVLGSDGRPPGEIWLLTSSGYKFVLTDSLSNPVGPSLDNITGIANLNNATLTGNTVIGTTGSTLNVSNGAISVVAGNTSLGGDLSVAGNTTLGNAGTDIVTVNAATLALVNATAVSGTASWSGQQGFGAGVTVGNVARAGGTILDWYEEGTPTFTIRGSTISGSPTLSQSGKFTRIGDRVLFDCSLSVSNWGGATGTVIVGGLPYAAAVASPIPAPYGGGSTSDAAVFALTQAASTEMLLKNMDGTNHAVAASTLTWSLTIQGSYRV